MKYRLFHLDCTCLNRQKDYPDLYTKLQSRQEAHCQCFLQGGKETTTSKVSRRHIIIIKKGNSRHKKCAPRVFDSPNIIAVTQFRVMYSTISTGRHFLVAYTSSTRSSTSFTFVWEREHEAPNN